MGQPGAPWKKFKRKILVNGEKSGINKLRKKMKNKKTT